MSESESPSPSSPEVAAPSQGEAALQSRITELEASLAAARDQTLRTAADLDNYRRRVQREKEELRRYAVGALLEDLLPVADGLGLGLETAKKTSEAAAVAEGFQMVVQQFTQTLSQHGLKVIEPSAGAFDPNQQEVIAQQPSDDIPEGHILALVRKGYWLQDRLLRPATVVLSAGPATNSGDQPEAAPEAAEA